jgi:CubicO group peptidase (beta-lactamase class C family)
MENLPGVAAARALLKTAVSRDRIFPAVVAEIGRSDGVIWRGAFGSLSFSDGAAPATEETVFDLASLAKPIATTSVIMKLLSDGVLNLEEPVSAFFPEWSTEDREVVTVQDLLEHASGLPARLLDQPPSGRREFEHDICGIPLEYLPRSRSVYSDLGFILLGFAAADRGHAPLDALFDDIQKRVPSATASGEHSDSGALTYHVTPGALPRTAMTLPLADDVRRGRALVGEVNDSYAERLGGVAGHAGLFGTAPAVGDFARATLRGARGDDSLPVPFSPALVGRGIRRSTVPASSRALGWDTMLPTSSCGTMMSASAFGHVGFTGTSLWIDPDRDRYYVLLTNRAAGGGTPDQMAEVRRTFHDLLAGV